ncbi:hypothetical protein NVT68_000205 [Clostridium botulinum]|uniref:hypothetical protein n=1 Tax=Clostridium TaxID=1485 RepID=UPI0005F94A85|nr:MULTISPECIES: hypothetical protein [Clostridium]MDI6918048.1 hypothetical protein [Clostridium botulinum]
MFNSFYPIERDEFHKKDRLYVFRIRELSEELINSIEFKNRKSIYFYYKSIKVSNFSEVKR